MVAVGLTGRVDGGWALGGGLGFGGGVGLDDGELRWRRSRGGEVG